MQREISPKRLPVFPTVPNDNLILYESNSLIISRVPSPPLDNIEMNTSPDEAIDSDITSPDSGIGQRYQQQQQQRSLKQQKIASTKSKNAGDGLLMTAYDAGVETDEFSNPNSPVYQRHSKIKANVDPSYIRTKSDKSDHNYGDKTSGVLPVALLINANDAGKGDLQISINQGKVPHRVKMESSGSCLVTFIPEHPGTYVIEVQFNGELIKGCPVRVDIHDKPLADSTIAMNSNTGFAASGNQQYRSSTHVDSNKWTSSGGIKQERNFDTSDNADRFISGQEQEANEYSSKSTYNYSSNRKLDGEGYKELSEITLAPSSYIKQTTTTTSTTAPNEAPEYRMGLAALTEVMLEKGGQHEKSLASQKPTETTQISSVRDEGSAAVSGTSWSRYDRYKETQEDRHHLSQTSESKWPNAAPSKYVPRLRSDRTPSPVSGRSNVVEQRYESITGTGINAITDTTTAPYHSKSYHDKEHDSRNSLSDDEIEGQHKYRTGRMWDDSSSSVNVDVICDATSATIYPVNRLATLIIRPLYVQANRIRFTLMGPPGSGLNINQVGKQIDLTTTALDDGYRLEFTPKNTGPHKLHIDVDGAPLPESPFVIETYDAQEMRISQISSGIIHRTVEFSVDATNAGHGSLKIAVTGVDGEEVPSVVRQADDNHGNNKVFMVSFEPTRIGRYTVNIHFNEESVPGNPFMCNITDGGGYSERDVKGSAHYTHYDQRQRRIVEAAVPLGKTEETHVVGESTEDLRSIKLPKQHGVGRIASIMFTTTNFSPSHGQTEVIITGPDGKIERSRLNRSGNDYVVEFTPRIVGEHTVDIKDGDGCVIGNCPYSFDVCDAKQIKVENMHDGVLGRPIHFIVDANDAGVGKLEVFVNGGNTKSVAESLETNRYDISFEPTEPGPHEVVIRFNDEPVPGSPFVCNVTNPEVTASGPGLRQYVPINERATFTLLSRALDTPMILSPQLLDVRIEDPTGRQIEPVLSSVDQSTYKVEYTPRNVGKHRIHLTYGGAKIHDSPFDVRCFDTSQIRLSPVENRIIGQESTFYIDATKAGAGNMEITISADRQNIPNEVVKQGDAAEFCVKFTPLAPVRHTITVKFNNILVPGSPMHVDYGRNEVVTPSLPTTVERSVVKDEQFLRQQSKTTTSTTVTAAKTPRSLVASKIEVKGDGLKRAPVNRPADFTLFTAGATSQDCNVIVTSPDGDAIPVRCYQLNDGNFRVQYTPVVLGRHKIDVSFADEPIPNSPFYCYAYDSTGGGVQIGEIEDVKVNQPAKIPIDVSKVGRGDLRVAILDLARNPVSCTLVENSNEPGAAMNAIFTPVTTGEHTFSATFDGRNVAGTPVKFEVREDVSQGVNANQTGIREVTSEPIAYGQGLERGVVNTPVTFTVKAGHHKGDIKLLIHGPTTNIKANVVKHPHSVYDVTYTPTELGPHRVSIQWNDRELKGSPFQPIIYNPDVVRLLLDDDNDGVKNPIVMTVGERRFLPVQIGNTGLPFQTEDSPITADIRDPEKRKLPVEISYKIPNEPLVTFIPQEEGKHTIRLFYYGHPLSSAPLKAIALPPSSGGEKIIDRSGLPATIATNVPYVDTQTRHDSGEESDDSSHRITRHVMNGHAEDWAKPRGPFVNDLHEQTLSVKVPSKSASEILIRDPRRIVLRGEGLREVRVNNEAEFIVDGSEADSGKPHIELQGHRADIPVKCVHLGNNVYRATYTPLMAGNYDLHVCWNGKPLAGSPFKVVAITTGDASKVTVAWDEVKSGIVGEDVKSTIDVRKAGPGTITTQCIGPSNKPVECELTDHKDGTFALNIKPQEVGKHSLIIKYGDVHVPGSPYALYISSPPDPSKVKVTGSGIQPGILSRFKSEFHVDTSGAGAGQLTVRVRGPKSAFNVEMTRESRTERVILCRYHPKEPGDYQIEVRWAGEPVPGSPFTVMIFDTESELERYRSGVPLPPDHGSQPYGFPPGWVGPPPPPPGVTMSQAGPARGMVRTLSPGITMAGGGPAPQRAIMPPPRSAGRMTGPHGPPGPPLLALPPPQTRFPSGPMTPPHNGSGGHQQQQHPQDPPNPKYATMGPIPHAGGGMYVRGMSGMPHNGPPFRGPPPQFARGGPGPFGPPRGYGPPPHQSGPMMRHQGPEMIPYSSATLPSHHHAGPKWVATPGNF